MKLNFKGQSKMLAKGSKRCRMYAKCIKHRWAKKVRAEGKEVARGW